MSTDESDVETPLSENAVKNDLIPFKSKERYIAVYETFSAWRRERSITTCCEEVLLAYFQDIATKYKPSTLWSTYSMLKCGLKCNENVNVARFERLSALLRKLSHGYVSKKAKSLTLENVEQFIDEAPDLKYLATKVALIFGVTGGLRRQELAEIIIDHVEDHGAVFVVKIPRKNNKLRGSFAIQGKYYDIVKKYLKLRKRNVPSTRFFLQYRDGKCFSQVIGKNRFGMMPKEVAEFLKLPDAKSYTGHSYRRMSNEKMMIDSCVVEHEEPAEDIADCSNSYVQCAEDDGKIEIVWEADNGHSSHERSFADSDSSPLVKPQVTAPPPPPLPQPPPPPVPRPLPNDDAHAHAHAHAQCRFCGDFKQCTPIAGKPYLMGEKTSLTLNHLKVELDFSIDSLPKTICKDCDKKLLDTFEFIKQVNAAQFSLVSVCQKDVNVPHVKSQSTHTHTRKNVEVDTQIVKIEFESSDDESQEDSLPLSETVYLREPHKRKKNKNKDKMKKKAKINDRVNNDTLNTELIIDIKEEKGSDDSNDEISGSDEKPCDDELLQSVLDFHNGNETFTNRAKGNSRSGHCND